MRGKWALIVCVSCIAGIAKPVEAAELIYKTFPIAVVVDHGVVEVEGEALPPDLINILVPVTHQECKEVLFFPEARITRVDTHPSYTVAFEDALDVERREEEASSRFLNTLQRKMGIKPEAADIQKVAREKLLAVKADAGLAGPAPSGDALKAARPWEVIERTGSKTLIVTPGLDDQEVLDTLRQKGVQVKTVENSAKVGAELARMLCTSYSEAGEAPRLVVWYKPTTATTDPSPLDNTPPPEAVQHVRQGLTYISLAKGGRGAEEKRENYRNAEASFTAAINAGGSCYATAYMNRGLVYALQDKPSLALRDLNRAVECDPEDATIRYNLAAVHSLSGDKDLSLEALDAALTRGFSDCDALRDDPDLKNVQKMPDYKRTVEKHKLFCF